MSQTCKKKPIVSFCRWAQQWSNIGDILKPYPGKPNLNVTGAMLSQVRIFIYCQNENFAVAPLTKHSQKAFSIK